MQKCRKFISLTHMKIPGVGRMGPESINDPEEF